MNFKCSRCGHVEASSTLKPRCDCGGLWNLDYTPPAFAAERIDKNEWSMFRYHDFMGLDGDSWKDISLGEGMTPIVKLCENVMLKMDYYMPTLSFKDRGAAVLVSHCKEIGVKSVVQDSSGNAGNSIAAYCARAGIECEIFVPEGTSPGKIAMISAHGAKVNIVPGTRDHCADVCRSRVFNGGAYYANHVFNPYFYEGTKTYIYEAFEQLGRIPENLVIPVGNGTLLLGAVMALEHLERSGAINHFPQIIALQSENCDPLLQAASRNETHPARVTPAPTLAEGIAIGQPLRGQQILELALTHGIRFIHARENAILDAQSHLARQGIFCELTTAANYAAYLNYCAKYGPTPDCLITMCGAGLKSVH